MAKVNLGKWVMVNMLPVKKLVWKMKSKPLLKEKNGNLEGVGNNIRGLKSKISLKLSQVLS
jgi:hypothetical protein